MRPIRPGRMRQARQAARRPDASGGLRAGAVVELHMGQAGDALVAEHGKGGWA